MQTRSRVAGERVFNITQKGKFRANDFKRGILPIPYFPTMQNETSILTIHPHNRFASKAYQSFCQWFLVDALPKTTSINSHTPY